MDNNSNSNVLVQLSDALAGAVEIAASSTVLVDARPRVPASGVAFSNELILTAHHAVERDDDIRVVLPDGEQVAARLAGRDSATDLALLRLAQASAVPAQPDLKGPRVGQIVLALGRPSREGIQASQGIVSARGGPLEVRRMALIEEYVRSDAIPYPGFSGGPLVDAQGRVVGINTTGLISGVALTIPADLAWQTADLLAKHGRVQRGFLGVRTQPVELPAALRSSLGREQSSGLVIVGVEPGSPADTGGLLIGDVITGMDDAPIPDYESLVSKLGGGSAGRMAAMEIIRAGQKRTVSLRIGSR